MQKIYKKIHPGEAVPNVYIRLNTDEKTLSIRVNFHSSERVVPPGGYLSEAQINTLGLALFLSSVRLFNKEFPFVFLDDIVSSYDADSRARIVDVLAEDMNEFQIFVVPPLCLCLFVVFVVRKMLPYDELRLLFITPNIWCAAIVVVQVVVA